MKTIFVNEKEQARQWYIIDAAGKPLGRVAAKAASVIRGKNKATYTPNQEMGDFVIVINSAKAVVTGGKEQKKLYHHYYLLYISFTYTSLLVCNKHIVNIPKNIPNINPIKIPKYNISFIPLLFLK